MEAPRHELAGCRLARHAAAKALPGCDAVRRRPCENSSPIPALVRRATSRCFPHRQRDRQQSCLRHRRTTRRSRGAPPGDAPKPGHRCAERGAGESSADASTMFWRLGLEEPDALPAWSRGACMLCQRTADLACHGRNRPGRSPGLSREVHPRPGFSRSSMTFPLHRQPATSIHCFVFPIPLQHTVRSKADPGLLQ